MPRVIFIPEYYENPCESRAVPYRLDYRIYQERADVFKYLNDRDKDVLLCMFVLGKTQNDIAEIFDFTQPKLSYDKINISKRVDFICELKKCLDRYLYFLEYEAGDRYTEQAKEIMTAMLYTTSFSRCAEITGIKYSVVRSTFVDILQKMKREDPDMYKIFSYIDENRNALRRIDKGCKFTRHKGS